MTATYTFDVFSSLDGFGAAGGDWTGYWGKQGPELLDHRLALFDTQQRMVFGANTFRLFVDMLASSTEGSEVRDPWVTRMRNMPATVVSATLQEPLDWPDASVASGDAIDVVARLKEESDVPLRSHGSLSMNRALMAAGLVDFVQVTLFPVIHGSDGARPDLPGGSRLRPGPGRTAHARRPHSTARLPADPAWLRIRRRRWVARGELNNEAHGDHECLRRWRHAGSGRVGRGPQGRVRAGRMGHATS
jgi:dihydrofolate reductase